MVSCNEGSLLLTLLPSLVPTQGFCINRSVACFVLGVYSVSKFESTWRVKNIEKSLWVRDRVLGKYCEWAYKGFRFDYGLRRFCGRRNMAWMIPLQRGFELSQFRSITYFAGSEGDT
ncbi:uncharacterized protein LOC117614316 isoform X2 [Prunus dulcis]|uniref:uncharacterized protein LOC117614316 isoform X2 n=1 Tax=Prunus dulcis TaxID=3755 RepID=UPI001483B1D1|nr:uncharacterized protein LOC117614316 isoform X2 [Prunus dulcis]